MSVNKVYIGLDTMKLRESLLSPIYWLHMKTSVCTTALDFPVL